MKIASARSNMNRSPYLTFMPSRLLFAGVPAPFGCSAGALLVDGVLLCPVPCGRPGASPAPCSAWSAVKLNSTLLRRDNTGEHTVTIACVHEPRCTFRTTSAWVRQWRPAKHTIATFRARRKVWTKASRYSRWRWASAKSPPIRRVGPKACLVRLQRRVTLDDYPTTRAGSSIQKVLATYIAIILQYVQASSRYSCVCGFTSDDMYK